MIPCTFTESIVRNLSEGGNKIACSINDVEYSYAEFYAIVGSIQGKILRIGSEKIGVSTQNDVFTYASIIAIWLTGKTYVPINAEYPPERLQIIVNEAEVTTILSNQQHPHYTKLTASLPECTLIDTSDLGDFTAFNNYPNTDKIAYILFTSGTTGKPKGVPISFGNLEAFLNGFSQMGYTLDEHDNFLQMFELTFDLSVMCFTVPLTIGASFHTLPTDMIKTLGLYHTLESKGITFSLMVPSAIQLLKPYLSEIELPKLRYSQFCGEALLVDTIQLWEKCVPNAKIDNVYGPTEATIYCTQYSIGSTISHLHGIVSIGKAMQNMKAEIFDETNHICPNKAIGELCLSGQQLTSGYLNNPEQNSLSFFVHDGDIFYRTGDLCMQDESGNIQYCGRKDNQVKIQGYRIELSEIEFAATKSIPGVHCIAVGYQNESNIWQLALFIEDLSMEEEKVKKQLSQHIPEYMVPHKVITIESIPLNSNGKKDRKLLQMLLQNNQS